MSGQELAIVTRLIDSNDRLRKMHAICKFKNNSLKVQIVSNLIDSPRSRIAVVEYFRDSCEQLAVDFLNENK